MRRLCLALAVFLFGCPAELDWREVQSAQGGFAIWLPARAFEESRPLTLSGVRVSMHQWSARARDTVFAVAYADFEHLQPGTLAAFSQALVGNIGGRVESEREITASGLRGRELRAAGQSGTERLALRLRLLASGNRLYEIALLGPPGGVSQADADTFFDSFRLSP